MPRRKIGADLKEALCKLYEAGDISADTIEKHGIMSRATFFRNLKMYKTGASLEQRYSTGRKTNADKLKQQEKQQLDALHPPHLSHLEVVLLLEDNEANDMVSAAARNKRKAKGGGGSSKRKDAPRPSTSEAVNVDTTHTGEDLTSESDGDDDEIPPSASQLADTQLLQAVRSFLASSENVSSADLDSLSAPGDSHYSHRNRGALFIVRRRVENRKQGAAPEVIAAAALRSLIWTPEVYQALGSSYANRSIDKICNLARLHVDPAWRRNGIGRWLVRIAELKASKLGFSQLYTQTNTDNVQLLPFWLATGFNEFARMERVARLEKTIIASINPSTATDALKRPGHPAPHLPQMNGAHEASRSAPDSKRRRTSVAGDASSANSAWPPTFPQALQLDPGIPLDPSIDLSSPSQPSLPARAADPGALRTAALSTPTQSSAETAADSLDVTTSAFPRADVETRPTGDPTLPLQTSQAQSHTSSDPPLRTIAFHDSSSMTSQPPYRA
ncbi:acetyltransferase [Pseudozyma hubeiensis SY62]|uniref:Acetyltransferase n=1 Tax=Pseudozyma hubeiensis (strain SY62) TaxID=1305764 RepID=R9P090_PSEHS|nr:acetyltransferase [Pseudozyma hubeiensis SY62]GAC94541.1 acetyltransferase [Pseudozyma hubeiensis SY62]